MAKPRSRGKQPRRLPPMSKRRRQVAKALLLALSEREMAARLGMSFNTLHKYVTQIYRLTGVHRRAQFLRAFLRR